MKKNVKNFISRLLVLAMIVALLPVFAMTANAASDDPYKTTPDTATPAEVKQEATVTETGKAQATVSEDTMNAALANAVANAEAEGKAPAVEVTVQVAENATALEVSLPAESLQKLAEDQGAVSIKSDVADIEIDSAALSTIVEGAASGPISLEVAPVATTEMPQAQQTALAKFESQASTQGSAPVQTQTYDLSLKSGDNAVHSFGKGSVGVSLKYTPSAGGNASNIRAYYLNDKGMISRCNNVKYENGKVSFTTKHFSTYVISDKALTSETKFSDISDNYAYMDYLNWAVDNGVTTGNDDGTFTPTKGCTRAQFVTFLYRAAGSPAVTGVTNPFTDVSATAHASYYQAILWAVKEGITTGETATTFAPDKTVTRGAAVTLMKRYADKAGLATKTGVENFTDVDAASAGVFYAPIGWAQANGITQGNGDGTFRPDAGCQRVEMVIFLERLFMETT